MITSPPSSILSPPSAPDAPALAATQVKPCAPMAGVWKRLFEDDPLGSPDEDIDHSTLVLWTQTPCGIYVDIRLPNGSPGRSDAGKHGDDSGNVTMTSLLNMNEDELNQHIDRNQQEQQPPQREDCIKSSLNPRALRARGENNEETKEYTEDEWNIIMKQKSFAGRLQFSWGDTTSTKGKALEQDQTLNKLATKYPKSLCTCFWKRDIDFQPPTGGLDIGVCCNSLNLDLCSNKTNNKDVVIGNVIRETGDDGSYAEGWMRQDYTEEGPFVALELLQENGIPRSGYWVRAGQQFAYAIGRPSTEEDAKTMMDFDNKVAMKSSHSIQHQIGKTLSEAVEVLIEEGKNEHSRNQERKTLLRNHLVHTYVACHGDIVEEYCDGDRALDGKSQDIRVHNLTNKDDVSKLTQDKNPDMDAKPIASSIWRIHYSTHPGLVGCHLMEHRKRTKQQQEDESHSGKRQETLLELLDQGDREANSKNQGIEHNMNQCCSRLMLPIERSRDRDDDEHRRRVLQVGDIVEQHLSETNNEDESDFVVRTWRIVELTHPSALII